MKIAILGYGLQGESSYHYWNKDGNQLAVCDLNTSTSVPEGVEAQLGEAYLNNLDRFDLIVRTPFLYPKAIVDANGPGILGKVTTNTNEFFRVCPSQNIIGVTGTKGKGTTSTLITKLLEADGKTVHLGGNIGTPPLDLLKNGIGPDDWVVLELANFQLIDVHYSPHIAICLMVSPEHLDWHPDTEDYFKAKEQLFRYQKSDDIAIYDAQNEISKRIAGSGEGRKLPYMEPPGSNVVDGKIMIDNQIVCETADLKLLGQHNWQNVCAAVTALWQLSQDITSMRSVITNFHGLPFRLEFRREVDGVRFYDDSFASAPPAAIAAIEAIPEKKVMIIGGFDRGLDLTELAEELKKRSDNIRKVLIIGASARRLAGILSKHGFTDFTISESKDMPGIVQKARELASPGDAVVLSPGFPSFDMFKNFEERGQQFNSAVEAL
jgi:UDP-N-acetylmuramoylalanine--D-glutamate ligase